MQIHPIIDPSLQRGSAAGQMLFWDGTQWVHTETSELYWNDITKVLAANGMIINGTIAIGLDMSGGTFATAVQNWPATPVIQAAGTQIIKFDDTNYNMLFGSEAFNNDEGQFNVGYGWRAGYNNDTTGEAWYGDFNLYVGYRSGYGLTTATNNTGFANIGLGVDTLAYNTSGNTNVAIGSGASFSNTSGASNMAIGTTTIYYNQSGGNNIAIGGFALQGVTGNSCWNNTVIGAYAGNSVTTGSNNIFIGYNAGRRQVAGNSLLIIDNQDRSTTAAEITDSLIYGVFNATPASQSLRFNIGTTTWHNATHTDADGGRASIFNFKGQQSGGEETTLARIEVSHDGAADDEKGKIVISTNDGDDTDTPTDHVKIDAAGNTYIGDGGTTNYTKIEPDGTIEFNGTATVWKDINLGSALLTKPAASAPDTDEFKDEGGNDIGVETYAFAPGEKVSGNFELQHDYKEGSNFGFHVHFQGIAAPTGTDKVKWQLIYTVAKANETLDATTTIVKEIDFDTQYEFLRANFAEITGTNFSIEDQFLFQLSRITASADEYGGDALIATVGLHYKIDTIGSRAVNTK